MNTADGIVVVDEAHNLEDRVRSANTERIGESGIIEAINMADKDLRKEERRLIQNVKNRTIRAVCSLYRNLNEQIRTQIKASKQDMKYVDRFSPLLNKRMI